MPLLSRIAIAWIVGLALARWLNLPWSIIVITAIPAASALFLYRNTPHIRGWAILGLAAIIAAFRLSFFQPTFDETHIAFYNDSPQPITLTGLIIDEPDVRDYYINLRVQAETLNQDDTFQPIEGLILVRAPRYPEYVYGDHLTITGKLETPPVFEDFSYKDYLARFGIHTMIRRPKINLVENNQGHPFWTVLLTFKVCASQTINRILPEPYAGLLNGILLGIESGIPRALNEDFNLTGTSHIIVISGSNIAIVAALFLFLGQRLVGRRYAPPLAIIGIIIYTLLVGADAAVSRAAVMGCVFVIGLWLGRPGFVLNALFASALVLTLINPLILWDAGLQLSFMATLGLIVLVPPLEQITFRFLQRRLNTAQVGPMLAILSELVIITLAAQISTGPLIIYHFGRLSLVSLLSNMLILPAQPPIMLFGAVATLAGMVWLPLGQILGWLVWLPLAWSVWMVEQTVWLPFASLNLGTFPFWLLLLSYAAIGAGVWWLKQFCDEKERPRNFRLPKIGSKRTQLMLTAVALPALLIWLGVGVLPDGKLHVAFLDVGQGDAILITLPDGRQLLIDGGPSATELNWRLGQEMPFWDKTLEMVINTHPDADHLGGLVSLLDRYRVGGVLVSDTESTSQLYHEWTAELAEDNLKPIVAEAATSLDLGAVVSATILSPGPMINGIDQANNHSVVVHVQMGQISFLLPGDIEKEVERRLVQNGMLLTATVLKSPHHGSKTSSSEPFLDAVNPQIVVISSGEDNRFGHPSPEVLDRYAAHGLPVLRTDQRGTIEFVTDGRQLWVEMAR